MLLSTFISVLVEERLRSRSTNKISLEMVDSVKSVQTKKSNFPPWTKPQGLKGVVWLLWIWFCWALVLFYLKIVNRGKFEGSNNIPDQESGILFVSNHISDLDPALIPAAIMYRFPTRMVQSVAKIELKHLPILGSMIKSYGTIFVDRTGKDLRAMRHIVRAMQNSSVLLFPEGTRSMDGVLLPGKRPVGHLIHMAKPIIVPAAVWGTIEAIPPTSTFPRIGKDLGVRFGPPLDMESLYQLPVTKENSQKIVDHVMEAIAEMVKDLKSEGRVIEI